MENRIEAIGRNTSVQTAPSVSLADGGSGRTEQTAATKPSLVVTVGETMYASAEVERVKDDEKERRHEDTVPAADFLNEHGVTNLI